MAMDLDGPTLLSNILTSEELGSISPQVQEKLKNYIDRISDEYCTEKASTNLLGEYRQNVEVLTAQIKDYEIKFQSFEQNVQELRTQLDTVTKERNHALESLSEYEKDVVNIRLDKNVIVDERDNLLKVIDRQNIEIERMQQDNRSFQQQLKNAIATKCDAIARIDEIESKETSLEFKERRMEQERTLLHNQIQTLTEDLNRNINELQNTRRDHTVQSMHLQTRLTEKVEELKIAQEQIIQYKESVERLNDNLQKLTSKMFAQNEDANKMMDYYKKELEAKTKLAELYKANCDDTTLERGELTGAITELKRLLTEASDQYGILETKFKATTVQHEQEVEEKEKIIETLKEELRHANDLLKEVQNESMENAISKLAPTAAVASRLIRSDMSLTEVYSLYVKCSEQLEVQKRENARCNLQLKTILHELNEKAPLLKKQEIDYEKVIETNNILAHQRDELLAKKLDMEEVMKTAHAEISQLQRENKKLKLSQNDLSRQVCYLLKEVQMLRIGMTQEHPSSATGNMATTDEVISKKLVTFKDIEEIQQNNQKLLLLVRDLSTKMEEAESYKEAMEKSNSKEKLDSYGKKFEAMQETLNQQNSTVSILVSKCERYKKMYFDLAKNMNKNTPMDLSDTEEGESDGNNAEQSSSTPSGKKIGENNHSKRIQDLENQLQEVKDHYKTLKEQYEYYIQEKKNNEKILNEQFDSMRSEVRELTSSNCKLTSTMEYSKEQIKLQQKHIVTYKQQISALESRIKNYESTIIKHEQTIHILKDEVLKAQRAHSSAETETTHLRHENQLLKDTAARLQAEKNGFMREQQNQNLLLNNLELIKCNLERSEMEGRARLEQRLDESLRELSAQRRRFQEEDDRFREMTNDLKRQAETAKQLADEERAQAEKLRKEISSIREELTTKSAQFDELSMKLQESLTPSKNDNPITLANKRARDLELKVEEAKLEITSLTNELAKTREHAEQYYKMSQSAETEIKNLHDLHTTYVGKADAEIKELKLTEMNLKSRITELESESQLMSVTETSNSSTQPGQLQKVQEELKNALQKLSECNRNLRSIRSENTELSESLNTVEQKYANEMVLHSADIQELTKLKSELLKIQTKISELTAERDCAQAALEEIKQTKEQALSMVQNERDELEKRITNLNEINSSLHEQIEALTTKLSILSHTTKSSTSFNESAVMDTSATECNRSFTEEDTQNSDKLFQIIKFLRKEKDLAIAKLDILKAENARLMSEHTMTQKKIDELNGLLNQERAKSETSISSATKHEEILRKIETLNAITDSNRILREERNGLANRVKELNERITTVEDELFPLQTKNRELSLRIDDITAENTSLRTEAIKWRQRANILVEKSNKNPEEFKRLQMERENLARMLTNEKENLKQTIDELNSVKTDKTRLDSEVHSLEKQLQTLTDEKKKLSDDFNSLKQNSARIMQEIMELKNKLLQKEDLVQKLTEDLESKEAQLQDSKNKEVQIRKIAKRYKDSYLELSNKNLGAGGDAGNVVAADNVELGGNNSSDGTNNGATSSELAQHRNTIDSLNAVIRNMQEEHEKVRKDFDEFKTSAEIDERTKSLLRDARARIVGLTESNTALTEELSITKRKLQSTENLDTITNSIKNQYEETVSRLEKDLLDQSNLHKEQIARLVRENDSLLMRINQLSRQLGLQQSAKPSTSSVAITDKSCISESSPRTANVKPMSGSTTVQQSATVTPWRGGETPLASIRPISVQNSRTAAILPTSQQTTAGGSSTSSSNTPSSAGSSNTALVPPQQQVHTTGSSSVEIMSSSPTSSHTDYIPSTSSASVAVAAITPMGSTSVAESSQEAESIQQPQQAESQMLGSGGQQQVVALVSPRVEGSSQSAPSPNLQHQLDPNNQQPSTSGNTSSSSHIAVSSHNRHTPSSSSVTTSQAGTSAGHKRPRESDGESSSTAEECTSDKGSKAPKRLRKPLHDGESSAVALGVSDSGNEVEYQVPTSSQRDQEDDIVVVDSDDDDGVVEADDGPADDAEHEGYEDSYEQDQDMDEIECPEVNESHIQADAEADNNEVDVDECMQEQAQCTSGTDNQPDAGTYESGASTSQHSATTVTHSQQSDNHQQSQTISSGSGEPNAWKQAPATFTRQQKATLMMLQQNMNTNVTEGTEQDPSGSRACAEFVSFPQDAVVHSEDNDSKVAEKKNSENTVSEEKTEEASSEEGKATNAQPAVVNVEEINDADEDATEEAAGSVETVGNVDSEGYSGATQSEIQDIQQSQNEVTSEDNEGTDGVSSEGEKPAVEEVEEEGREAEATTPSTNTRSKATKGSGSRRPGRGYMRGHGGNRPTPIIWQESPGNSRNPGNQRNQDQPGSPLRGFPNQRSSRARRMRRPTGGSYGNMRYP